MKYWLIYYDDFSNGWTIVDYVGFRDEAEAKALFNTLAKDDVWYHIKQMSVQ